MSISIKIFIFLTILSASVFSAPIQNIYEKVISGGENIVDVNPLLDLQNELNGFVYSDTSLNKIIIDYYNADSTISLDVPSTPLKTIVRYSELKDSLYIYTLTLESNETPQITLTTYTDDFFTQQTITTPTFSYLGFEQWYSSDKIEHLGFRFYPNDQTPEQIIFEFSYRVDELILSMGSESFNIPTTLIYSLDLDEILLKSRSTYIYPAYLYSSETMNFVYGEKYFLHSDLSEDIESNSYQNLTINKLDAVTSSNISTLYDDIHSVHVDNFAPSTQEDEIIIHSSSEDLLRTADWKNHIACYEFSSGNPSEIWYNDDVSEIDFSYVFKAKDLLIGTQDNDKILMLNFLNGEITDSSLLNSSITNQHFFETGLEQLMLNVVGMSYDTVKAFRFDVSTDINISTEREIIPKTFDLFQNHPNPFNGETRLEFSTDETQYLKLSIFNILGQEIKLLIASKFSPGTYSYYWNGSNENGLAQSTGIYFARLESETSSSMIKLIYLK